MIRQTLLVETLVTRTITRRGPVFMYRRPQGPPVTSDDSIDRWLHKTTQAFDFSPMFNGDQYQSRIVAERYLAHLKKESAREGMDWGEVASRLKQISPHLRRGFQTFFSFFDASVRTSG